MRSHPRLEKNLWKYFVAAIELPFPEWCSAAAACRHSREHCHIPGHQQITSGVSSAAGARAKLLPGLGPSNLLHQICGVPEQRTVTAWCYSSDLCCYSRRGSSIMSLGTQVGIQEPRQAVPHGTTSQVPIYLTELCWYKMSQCWMHPNGHKLGQCENCSVCN